MTTLTAPSVRLCEYQQCAAPLVRRQDESPAHAARRRFCSSECANRARSLRTRATKACEACGVTIVKVRGMNNKDWAGRRWCSHACRFPNSVMEIEPMSCESCGKPIEHDPTRSVAQRLERKYCSPECVRKRNKVDPLARLAGPVVEYDLENPPPCFLNSEFFAFEGRIEETLRLRLATKSARPEYIRNMMIEASRRWCGGCPIREQCLKRAVEDQMDGIAGGAWLQDGIEQ